METANANGAPAVSPQLFADVKYCIGSKTADKACMESLKSILDRGGAKLVNYLSDNVTHLIADEADEDEISEATEIYEKPVVTTDWVIQSVRCGVQMPIHTYSPIPRLFTKVRACIKRIGSDDLKHLWAMITYHGGIVQRHLDRRCTHLICGDSSSGKYAKALRYTTSNKNSALKIVTPDWVPDSIEKGNLIDESVYHPRLIVPPTPVKSEPDPSRAPEGLKASLSTASMNQQNNKTVPMNSHNTQNAQPQISLRALLMPQSRPPMNSGGNAASMIPSTVASPSVLQQQQHQQQHPLNQMGGAPIRVLMPPNRFVQRPARFLGPQPPQQPSGMQGSVGVNFQPNPQHPHPSQGQAFAVHRVPLQIGQAPPGQSHPQQQQGNFRPQTGQPNQTTQIFISQAGPNQSSQQWIATSTSNNMNQVGQMQTQVGQQARPQIIQLQHQRPVYLMQQGPGGPHQQFRQQFIQVGVPNQRAGGQIAPSQMQMQMERGIGNNTQQMQPRMGAPMPGGQSNTPSQMSPQSSGPRPTGQQLIQLQQRQNYTSLRELSTEEKNSQPQSQQQQPPQPQQIMPQNPQQQQPPQQYFIQAGQPGQNIALRPGMRMQGAPYQPAMGHHVVLDASGRPRFQQGGPGMGPQYPPGMQVTHLRQGGPQIRSQAMGNVQMIGVENGPMAIGPGGQRLMMRPQQFYSQGSQQQIQQTMDPNRPPIQNVQWRGPHPQAGQQQVPFVHPSSTMGMNPRAAGSPGSIPMGVRPLGIIADNSQGGSHPGMMSGAQQQQIMSPRGSVALGPRARLPDGSVPSRAMTPSSMSAPNVSSSRKKTELGRLLLVQHPPLPMPSSSERPHFGSLHNSLISHSLSHNDTHSRLSRASHSQRLSPFDGGTGTALYSSINATSAATQVTPKTKSALANLLNNRIGTCGLSRAEYSCGSGESGPPSPSLSSCSVYSSGGSPISYISSCAKAEPLPFPMSNSESEAMQMTMPRLYGHDPKVPIPDDKCLVGCVFFIVDYQELDPIMFKNAVEKIKLLAGEVDESYSPRVTHVLCDNQSNLVVQQAIKEQKRCITSIWLVETLINKRMNPPWHVLHFPPAHQRKGNLPCREHIISVTNWATEEREHLKQIIRRLGAKYTTYFTPNNTVLISKTLTSNAKLSAAKTWKIGVVNIRWLIDIYFGLLDIINLPTTIPPKYLQFDLKDPFRVDYNNAVKFYNPWKSAIKVYPSQLLDPTPTPPPVPPILTSTLPQPLPPLNSDENHIKSSVSTATESLDNCLASLKVNGHQESSPSSSQPVNLDEPVASTSAQADSLDSNGPPSKKLKTSNGPVVTNGNGLDASHSPASASANSETTRDDSTTQEDMTTMRPPRPENSHYRIMLTRIPISKHEVLVKLIQGLGATLVTDARHVTHLVSSGVNRTLKFIQAMNFARHVITPEWLIESSRQRRMLPEQEFAVKDLANERLFGFSLREALERRDKRKGAGLFAQTVMYITPNTSPTPNVLKDLVEIAGGVGVTTLPPTGRQLARLYDSGQKFVVITCDEDMQLVRKQFERSVPLVNVEFILQSLLKQDVEFAPYRISWPTPPIPVT